MVKSKRKAQGDKTPLIVIGVLLLIVTAGLAAVFFVPKAKESIERASLETEKQLADRVAKARVEKIMGPIIRAGNTDAVDQDTLNHVKEAAAREGVFTARMYFYILKLSGDKKITDTIFKREFQPQARSWAGMENKTVKDMESSIRPRILKAISAEKSLREAIK